MLVVLSTLGIFSFLSGWVIVRVLRPARPGGKAGKALEAPSEEVLQARIADAKSQEIDVRGVEQELALLQQRRSAGVIHVALFGDISSGKSSLVKALLPGSQPSIDVAGGTTRSLVEYTDTYRRTAEGWKIATRYYNFNFLQADEPRRPPYATR